MRMPPKPILIRIAIYGSLISFFGWRAYERFSAQQDADEAAEAQREASEKRRDELLKPTRTMELGDGAEIPVVELTESQLAELGIAPPPSDDAPPPPTEVDEGDAPTTAVVPEPETAPAPDPQAEVDPEAAPEPRPEPRVNPRFAPPLGDPK